MTKEFSSVPWSDYSGDWDLQSDQVDIWRISLELSTDHVKSSESVLSADENQRAARFVFPRDRNRFILAHGHMRGILARYLHCEPDQVTFSANEYGKPALTDGSLEFNLSHSGVFALLAISKYRKVGVDVEWMGRGVELEALARRFFSDRENAEFASVPRESRVIAFYRCWTLKEAYIKAHGLGLSLPLDSFDVSLTPNDNSALKGTRPNPEEASHWILRSLDVDPDYAAALAVEKGDLEVRLWNGNLSLPG
jgi:4'-phosphopantetheinyl transferase